MEAAINQSFPIDRFLSQVSIHKPERRSFPVDYSGYLSSPDHRPPNGHPEQRIVYGPQGVPIGYVHSRPTGTISNTIYGETTYNPYGINPRPASVSAIHSQFNDDALIARHKMESMERQLANLTGLVQGVLQPDTQLLSNDSNLGLQFLLLFFFFSFVFYFFHSFFTFLIRFLFFHSFFIFSFVFYFFIRFLLFHSFFIFSFVFYFFLFPLILSSLRIFSHSTHYPCTYSKLHSKFQDL